MRDLRTTLVQSMLHWEDATANRAMFVSRLEALKGTTDLVVLPEMFTTGFSMRAGALAEPMDGPTVRWMRSMAATLDAAIYGSAVITEDGSTYNRGLFVEPDGRTTSYDKRHLFRFAGEDRHYTPGNARVIVEWRGWRILLQVCYDLRFPVFSRQRGDYDLALYVANWPEARRYPWDQLLIARAIENQTYVVGVNRVGMDGKGIHYSGGSTAIDPRGAVIARAADGREELVPITLSMAPLVEFREKFPAGLDADRFTLHL